MKIDKVILSTNENPLYYPFWNVASKQWKQEIGIEPILFYIGDTPPDVLG